MLKIFHLVFIIFSLLVPKSYGTASATVSNKNPDDEVKFTSSDETAIRLVPYTNVFDSINYDSKKNFEVFIDPHTQQLFYRPKTKEAIEELVDKIKFSESIYTQARVSKKKQAPNHEFSHEPKKYLSCFKKALVEITETQRISEINLRDILSYLASLHDLPSMPDIWDAIKDTLGIYYDFTFTEKSYISLDFSLGRSTSEDWIEDTIATVNDSCKLATHLGFKLDLDKSNPKFGDVYKKAQTYKSKAAITPSDASHEYIAMLRSADSLYQLLIEGFLASEEHLTKFKNKLAKKYNNNYELRINNNSSKSELLAELIRILSKEDNLSEISLSEEENGNYIFDYDSTLEKYCTKKTARYRRRDAPVSYTKKIKIIESKINECRGNILFAREVRKHQAPKHEDDYIFILLDEVREFQKTKQEIYAAIDQFIASYNRPQKEKKEPIEQKKKTTDAEDQQALAGMSAVLKDILPKDSKSNMSNNGNDDEFSEEEIKNVLAAEANLAKQGLSTTDDYAIIRHQQKTSEEKLISKNPSKRVKAVRNSMKSSAVESASASIGSGMHKKNSIMAIFRQKNQSNIDFYDTLRAQSKSLADSASFAADFFHQAAQPKYPVFKNDLISHGFKVVSHGEKDHFCWKANNKFYHFAVDRPHGPQSEKVNTAGWFLRLQQKITESGLLEANSAETAAKK